MPPVCRCDRGVVPHTPAESAGEAWQLWAAARPRLTGTRDYN